MRPRIRDLGLNDNTGSVSQNARFKTGDANKSPTIPDTSSSPSTSSDNVQNLSHFRD
jgi:hypothetical protein